MKRFLKITTVVAMMAIAWACTHDDTVVSDVTPDVGGSTEVADGSLVRVRFGVKIPDPISVATRAVDPDGNGIQTMTLFCFNGEGLLISTATAILEPDPNDKDNETGGILDADIPNTTRVIHLLANQNMSQFKEGEFRNLSEDQVIANLEGSSGMMIYWARVEIPTKVVGSAGILEWITVMTNPTTETFNNIAGQNQPIIMLRNQAKVMVDAGGTTENVEKDWVGDKFIVEGFAVVNTQAFGTVAPFHTTYGYPTYACTSAHKPEDYSFAPSFGLVSGTTTNWLAENYVNMPRKSYMLSNISDVDTAPQTYIFETENSSANPVGVIIKGKNVVNGVAEATKYYRVTLTDSKGEQVLVRRNHCYTVNIKGNLLYGVDTFGEALDAPATNNVWLSISDEVKSVQNNEYKLTVDQTSVVIDEVELEAMKDATTPASLNLTFSVEALGTTTTIDEGLLSVSWVSGQDVSSTDFGSGTACNFTIDGKSATGKITISLLDLNDDKNEGTILVKYGQLQRTIKVVVVKIQKFTPAWVTGQVYGTVGNTKSNATMMFTIPGDCPKELFPLNVLISVNELDVRSESGQVLPIIRKGEEGYGEDNGIGYKYVYEVTEPGMQYLYMRSILNQNPGTSIPIKIEAVHFNSVVKEVVFTEEEYIITVANVTTQSSLTGNIADNIYYTYLPQKKNAPFAINLMLSKGRGDLTTAKTVGMYDEFLLYSQNLDAYADSETETAKKLIPEDPWLSATNKPYFPCQFASYDTSVWDTGGRVYAFMPRKSYYDALRLAQYASFRNNFCVYMKTNKAKSAEMIRVSSNQSSAKAAFTTEVVAEGVSDTEVYKENEASDYLYSHKGTVISSYRSMVFELRNYPAFRFAAQVNGAPTYDDAALKNLSDDEEAKTPVQIAYVPGTEVRVSFDVTSFTEKEDDGVDDAEVDPFGANFYIFIQTPNLDLADDQNGAISKVDDTGLYRYEVNADRTAEAAEWSVEALQSGIAGERKEIVFKTKTSEIVTEGDIVIYADPEAVTYKSKTFNVTNTPIVGTIKCGDNTVVPAGQFISFSRELDGSRIGSITVTSDGNYELRLRKEYEFTWAQNDPVKLYARVGGEYYSATYANLAALYASPNVVLTLQQETDGE